MALGGVLFVAPGADSDIYAFVFVAPVVVHKVISMRRARSSAGAHGADRDAARQASLGRGPSSRVPPAVQPHDLPRVRHDDLSAAPGDPQEQRPHRPDGLDQRPRAPHRALHRAQHVQPAGRAGPFGPVRRPRQDVLESVRQLEREGHPVTILPVGGDGLVDLDRLAETVSGETAVVSIMAVNNEIGVIQPIAEIAAICREVNIPQYKSTLVRSLQNW